MDELSIAASEPFEEEHPDLQWKEGFGPSDRPVVYSRSSGFTDAEDVFVTAEMSAWPGTRQSELQNLDDRMKTLQPSSEAEIKALGRLAGITQGERFHLDSQEKHHLAGLDSLFDKFRTSEPIILYRGLRPDQYTFALKHNRIETLGIESFTSNIRVAALFAEHSPILAVTIPAGVGVIPAWRFNASPSSASTISNPAEYWVRGLTIGDITAVEANDSAVLSGQATSETTLQTAFTQTGGKRDRRLSDPTDDLIRQVERLKKRKQSTRRDFFEARG